MKKRTIVALAILAGLAAGCGKSEKTYKTGEGEVTVKENGDQIAYEGTTKEGKFKMSVGEKGVALPDDFPKDIPIMKGTTVKTAMTQGPQTIVHLYAAKSIADAAKFYQDELKVNGWTIENSLNMGDTSMVAAKKGNRQCNVVATKEGDGVLVQLVVVKETP